VRIAERPTLSSDVRLARATIGDVGVDDLPPAERAIAATLAPERQLEFAAGRAAARAALAALCGAGDYVIGRDADGAPTIGIAGVRVSITHTRAAVAAVAGRAAALGVDLCAVADAARVRRVAPRFIVAEERAMPGDDVEWATLWALKEASAKAVGVGLLEGGLKATRLAALAPPRFARPELHAETAVEDGMVLAVVWR